jgi:hypothetical protein
MTALLLRRYLAEYARRPLNLVLLAVVPVVFVILSAGAIADFARILGGPRNHTTLETATAGWAAALLAGIAGFFQVNSSRLVDRRIAAAGAGTARVVAARLATGVVLAAVAVTGALVALWIRTGITDVPRAVGATAMFALIYLAIGAGVGAVVHSELNGSLIVVFVWMFDLFLGPAMGGSSRVLTRVFPTHFPTLIMINVATRHAGPLGDLGASLVWTIGGLALATIALVATTRPARARTVDRQTNGWTRMRAGIRYGFRDYRRNVALWVLLVTLPVAFITLSIAVTPDNPVPVSLLEHGRRAISILRMPTVHGAFMVPITIAFLSGLAGLFVVLGSAQADRRLTLAGFRTREILTARFAVIAFAAGLTTIVSIAVTATDFAPHQWAWFAVANVLVALTYAMLGVLIGPVAGKLGGLYLMLLLPFIDVGLAQNVMFDAAPPAWSRFMPAHGAIRILVDASFTSHFDEWNNLALALAWLIAITAAAAITFHHLARTEHA